MIVLKICTDINIFRRHKQFQEWFAKFNEKVNKLKTLFPGKHMNG